MPIGASTRVDGLDTVLREIAKIDPEIKKQLRKDARQITKPIIDDAKQRYPTVRKKQPPIRGTAYKWENENARGPFPFDAARARRGLKFSVEFTKRGTIIRVRQVDGAAILLENVGKGGNFSGLASAVAFRYGMRDRFLWASAEKKLPAVRDELRDSIRTMLRDWNRRNR